MMKTFFIKSLGCKVNSYESEYIRNVLIHNDMSEVSEGADVCIVNTCTVTNTADNKSKQVINNIRKNNKDAIIVAMGCFCQFRSSEIKDLISADVILGNQYKSQIYEILKEYKGERIIRIDDMNSAKFDDMEIPKFYTHHRAFIKVEDGCNNFCSYCIIPYVRGRVRSKDFDKVINEARNLILHGHKELVLAGIHTGQYSSDGKRLYELINELSKIDGLERIRLSSVEIVELDEGMMDVIKNNPKFVSHLHIPLQSGSDNILKAMNRRYDLAYFEEKVKEIRSKRSDIALSTDVIVGFPGESEEDFQNTLNFCKKIGFSKIHVFPYSDRNGTVASGMKNKIPGDIKKDRVHRLISLSMELEREYYTSFVGKKVSVLIEEKVDDKYLGFTSNYIPLKLNGEYNINQIYDIVLKEEDINFEI